jgi:hemolysin III
VNPDCETPVTAGAVAAGLHGKPLLRGWFHAVAALGAVAATVGLLLRTQDDPIRLLSMLVFGLSMIELYALSAVYHIGSWQGRRRTVLRALDHANIFVLIAGTYTPICVNVLSGWLRTGVLALIWSLALAGVIGAVFTLRLPRWLSTGLYIVMGWVSVAAAPEIARILPWEALGLLVGGGVLYSVGALIYALRRPDPFPRVFGYHEIFHLFVIAGSAAFLFAIWVWVVPFPRS